MLTRHFLQQRGAAGGGAPAHLGRGAGAMTRLPFPATCASWRTSATGSPVMAPAQVISEQDLPPEVLLAGEAPPDARAAPETPAGNSQGWESALEREASQLLASGRSDVGSAHRRFESRHDHHRPAGHAGPGEAAAAPGHRPQHHHAQRSRSFWSDAPARE